MTHFTGWMRDLSSEAWVGHFLWGALVEFPSGVRQCQLSVPVAVTDRGKQPAAILRGLAEVDRTNALMDRGFLLVHDKGRRRGRRVVSAVPIAWEGLSPDVPGYHPPGRH